MLAEPFHRLEPEQQICGACSSPPQRLSVEHGQVQPCGTELAVLQGLLVRAVSPEVKASPSKPGAQCDMAAEDDPVDAMVADNYELPYSPLYDAAFTSVSSARDALHKIASHLKQTIEPVDSKEKRGGKKQIYRCAHPSCTDSIASGKSFRLVLRRKGKLFQFVRECAQHQHGYLCSARKPITAAAGNLQEVRDFLLADPTVSNATLMKHLVQALHFDRPPEVRMTENTAPVLSKKWSQVMSRVKKAAWRGLCGPELNELAVWVQRFNEDPENGYAVMRLRAPDGMPIVYDGISGDVDPIGEFYSFSVVFRPTLLTSYDDTIIDL
jgi:hypothetical protein